MMTLGTLSSHTVSARVRSVQLHAKAASLHVAFKPLHRNFGAVVVGLDLTQPDLRAGVRGLLNEAMQEYDMLLFRGQELHPRDQERLALVFPHDAAAVAAGRFCNGFFQPRIPAHPLLVVRGINVKCTSDYHGIPPEDMAASVIGGPPFDQKLLWHQDLSDSPTPPEISAMYMVQVPRNGGQTLFASSVSAYHELDTAEQAFFGGLRTCSYRAELASIKGFKFDMTADGTRRVDDSELSGLPLAVAERALPPVPLVIQDPDTGKTSFLVSPQLVSHLEGLGRQESLDIVERLLKKATSEDKVYTHEWQPHDFVLWANRRMWHSGTPTRAYLHDSTRLFHLVFLDSDRPVQAAAAGGRAPAAGATAPVGAARPEAANGKPAVVLGE